MYASILFLLAQFTSADSLGPFKLQSELVTFSNPLATETNYVVEQNTVDTAIVTLETKPTSTKHTSTNTVTVWTPVGTNVVVVTGTVVIHTGTTNQGDSNTDTGINSISSLDSTNEKITSQEYTNTTPDGQTNTSINKASVNLNPTTTSSDTISTTLSLHEKGTTETSSSSSSQKSIVWPFNNQPTVPFNPSAFIPTPQMSPTTTLSSGAYKNLTSIRSNSSSNFHSNNTQVTITQRETDTLTATAIETDIRTQVQISVLRETSTETAVRTEIAASTAVTTIYPEFNGITINFNQTNVDSYLNLLTMELLANSSQPQYIQLSQYGLYYFNGVTLIPVSVGTAIYPSTSVVTSTSTTFYDFSCDEIGGNADLLMCKRNNQFKISPSWFLLLPLLLL